MTPAGSSRSSSRDELIEMTSVAESVLRRTSGNAALAALGWAPTRLDDEDDRRVTAALFRAAGRTCATTPALGRLAAGMIDGAPPGSAIGLLARRQADSVQTLTFVTGPAGLLGSPTVVVLADEEIRCASSVMAAEPGTDAMDRAAVEHGWIELAACELLAAGAAADQQHDARRAARLAIAHEILGACDGAMSLALDYAGSRRQFGSPIGSFQAVQHILAEAETQRRALDAACAVAVRTGVDASGAAHLKALAGRAGRVVMQNTLQVLGAIGFTEEHGHHRFYRRVLTLDALFGSSATLRRDIGSDAIASRRAWQYPVMRRSES